LAWGLSQRPQRAQVELAIGRAPHRICRAPAQ
jgi:hypothetical protein